MMTSRNILNLTLLGIVSVLVLVVIFEPGKTPEKPSPSITTLKKESISKIDIKQFGNKDIQFRKIKHVWQMTSPYQLPANEYRISSILGLVETKSYSQHDLTKLNKSNFKLDKPKVVVTFNDKLSVAFGSSEPLNHRRYVQVGNTLNLINDSVYYHVTSKPTALVSSQLLPKNTAIKAIQLPDRKLELKDGRWQIEKEPKDMASDAVTQLLNNWKLALALDVVAAKDKPGKQQIKLFVEGRNKPIVFSIVKRKPDFVLLREDKGVEYQLMQDSAQGLLTLAKPEPVKEKPLKEKTATHSK